MSLVCAGGLIGNVIYLWVLEKFGRKIPILFLSVPIIVRSEIPKYSRSIVHVF